MDAPLYLHTGVIDEEGEGTDGRGRVCVIELGHKEYPHIHTSAPQPPPPTQTDADTHTVTTHVQPRERTRNHVLVVAGNAEGEEMSHDRVAPRCCCVVNRPPTVGRSLPFFEVRFLK